MYLINVIGLRKYTKNVAILHSVVFLASYTQFLLHYALAV